MKVENGSNRDMGVAVTSPIAYISLLEEAFSDFLERKRKRKRSLRCSIISTLSRKRSSRKKLIY